MSWLPLVTILVVLIDPANPDAETVSREMQAAAGKLGLKTQLLHASTERDFDGAFAALGLGRLRERAGANGSRRSRTPG